MPKHAHLPQPPKATFAQQCANLFRLWSTDSAAALEILKWFGPMVVVLYLHTIDHFGAYTPLVLDPLFVVLFWKINGVVSRQVTAARQQLARV